MGRHEKIKSRSKVERKSFRLGRSIAAIGAAAAVLSGCTLEQDAAASNYEVIITTLPPPPPALDPSYACDPATEKKSLPAPVLQEAAVSCINSRIDRVALVGFAGIGQAQLDAIAEQTAGSVHDAFDGLLQVTLDTMPASPDAEAQFQSINSAGCVETNSGNRGFGSDIAAIAMGLDKQYDYVAAVSPLAACGSEQEAGRITHGYGDCCIELFSPAIADRSGFNQAGPIFAHEYGHAYAGFGHASRMSSEPFANILHSDDYPLIPAGVPFNVMDAIQTQSFEEYGDKFDIMGNHYESPEMRLNGVQRRQLTWPERALGTIEDTEKRVNGATIRIDKPLSKQHAYAALELDRRLNISYTSFRGQQLNIMADKLVFDPIVTDSGDSPFIQVYLASNFDSSSLSLGHIPFGEDSAQPYVFQVTGQTVEVAVSGSGFDIREVTA